MKRSKKGIELLIGSSDVNSIFGCRELRKDRKIGTEDIYINKTNAFLSSSDFCLLSKNPFPSYVKSTRALINNITTTLMYFNSNSYFLLQSNPKIPLLYSLPKIHKDNIPIRPIVSFVGSPVYKISIFLNKIFKAHLPIKFDFSLRNSIELANLLSELE